jgi:hypothetical protein
MERNQGVATRSGVKIGMGSGKQASGANSSVSGGEEREAPDDFSWVAGELFEPN